MFSTVCPVLGLWDAARKGTSPILPSRSFHLNSWIIQYSLFLSDWKSNIAVAILSMQIFSIISQHFLLKSFNYGLYPHITICVHSWVQCSHFCFKKPIFGRGEGFCKEKYVTPAPREPLILEPSPQAKMAMTCLKLSTLRVSHVTWKTVFVVVIQLLSHVWLLWPHGLQHAKLFCPLLSPGVYPNSCPLRRWCQPTISSCRPLLLLPSVFPSIRVFSNESALSWHQVAKVLELQL